MAGGIVGWHFLDVESGIVPEESSPSVLPSGGKGRIVVIAATPFTYASGWAARAAVALAKDWSQEGLRIFLMDLGLESPSLHDVLGMPNGEGVSDAFLYGASVQHIANPAPDESFFFAPAGSASGDPAEVLGHPRWNDLAGGFSEADATLLLFLPTEIPGAGKILSRATDIVFLSAQGESADTHLGPASIKVVSMMGPFGSPPEEIPESSAPAPEESPAEMSPELSSPAPVEEPAEAADEDLGSGLDLAEGFGLEEAGEEEEAPSFDFSGGLELADGFGGDEEGEESTARDGRADPEGGIEEESEEAPDFSGDFGLLEEDSSEGFGDDLVMGADISGGSEMEEPSGGELAGDSAPDFGAEFVEMGPVDDAPADGGEFGGDLVQGPDFGGPAEPDEGGMAARDEGPPSESDEAAQEKAPVQARKKPAPKRRPPPKKKFPVRLVAALVIVLGAVGAAAGTALGYLNVPGLTFLQDYFGDVPDPPLVLAGSQPTDEVLRFSLVLFSYDETEISDAVDMQDALRSRLPDYLFLISPVEVAGEPVYELLAGPALDRIEAEDLRGPLAEVLTREDPDAWTVRETPRAFYLGERPAEAEAREYMESLSLEGIFAYILHVSYADGSEGFEVLSGAYEGIPDARPLQLSLRKGGFMDAPLIERRGRLPE